MGSDVGELLNEETSKLNMGTYNYAPSTAEKEGAEEEHLKKDVLPYSFRGNVDPYKKER